MKSYFLPLAIVLSFLALNCQKENINSTYIIGQRFVVCPTYLGNLRNSEADLIDLKDGRLLLAYSKYWYISDEDDACISGKISLDSGKTWGDSFVLQENVGKVNVTNPSFLRLSNGALLLFFSVKNDFTDCNLYKKVSFDEGKSWSLPEKVSFLNGYHVINHNKVIQTKTGRIIVPASYTRDFAGGYKIDSLQIFCYYSDDFGKTWKNTNFLTLRKSPAMEPAIVETGGGKLLMLIRSNNKRIFASMSSNNGENWLQPYPLPLTSPSSPASIIKYPTSDTLLLIWNHHKSRRNPLNSSFSSDHGKSWKNFKTIEYKPENEYSYTSIRFIFNKVYLTYYEENEKTRHSGLILNIVNPRTFTQ
jgi:sialidase-1